MFARSRKSDRTRAQAAPRIRVAASGRNDEARLCGARRQRVCVTDKVNIPELQKKLQRRIDMVAETAKRLAELNAGAQ